MSSFESLARLAGIDGVDSRKLSVFAESLLDPKEKEIDELKRQLTTAILQNEIYKGALYETN